NAQHRYAQQLLKAARQKPRIRHLQQSASFENVLQLFRKGWYVVPLIITPVSHCVLITSLNNHSVTFHDPGLPPKKNRTLTRSQFAKVFGGRLLAWRKLSNN